MDVPANASGFDGWRAATALALLSVLLYMPTLGNGYVFDDVAIVQQNPVVQEGRYLEALTAPYWPALEGIYEGASNWRPLTVVSLTLERGLSKAGDPFLHHATNAVLHGFLVLALFPLARRFAGPGWALAACALFAVHPAHTEAVAPVVGRADLLAAIGALLALECFLRFRDTGARRWLAFGAAAYAIGLAGKESAASVLVLLPVADWLLGGKRLRELAGRTAPAYLPCAGVAAVWVAGRVAVLGGSAFRHGHALDYSLGDRLVLVTHNLFESMLLLAAPVRFHHLVTTLPDSAPFTYPQPGGLAAVGYALVTIVATLGWIPLVARAPRLVFLWLGALVTWMPSSGLLPAAAGVSLRFLLLPTAFAACAAAMGLAWLARTRPRLTPTLQGVAVIAVVAGAVVSIWRCTQWRDNGVFYRAIVTAEPRCPTAHVSLGTWLASVGPRDLDRAREHYRRAIEITGDSPQSFAARLNLAISYELGETGTRYAGPGVDLVRSVRIYRELIERHPARSEPLLNLAIVLDRQGRHAEAARRYRDFLERFPGHGRADAVRERLEQIEAP